MSSRFAGLPRFGYSGGERTAGEIRALPGSVGLLRHTTRPRQEVVASAFTGIFLLVCVQSHRSRLRVPVAVLRSLHTSPRKPSGHCFLRSSVDERSSPKGASGTVQSRAFAPEATLCVKNVKQSKVRWMRAVLASRTELVCASNATAVVPDCDTGHEGEFLIYANYGE